MSNVTYDYMEKFIKGLIPEEQGILKEIREYASINSVPIVQKEVANLLRLLVSIKKPNRILELGTAIGYSSILMNFSADKNCDIVTIDRDTNMIEIAQKNILKAGIADKIKIIQGDCLELLQNMDDKFDMIFIDAGKGHYNHFLPYCLKMLSEDGIIVADNVLFRGMVASKELLIRRKITIVKRMQKYLDMVCNNNDLITTVIPMGDGVAITKRKN